MDVSLFWTVSQPLRSTRNHIIVGTVGSEPDQSFAGNSERISRLCRDRTCLDDLVCHLDVLPDMFEVGNDYEF